MTEFVFVLLFTAAGAAAALLALRAGSSAPAIRWLSAGFLGILAANLGIYAWPLIADDPAGTARRAAIAALLVLAVLAYARFVRAAKRAAGERDRR